MLQQYLPSLCPPWYDLRGWLGVKTNYLISIYLSIYLSIYPSTIYLCIYLSLGLCLSIYVLSIYVSVCLSVCLSIYLSIYPYMCLSVCLSVCLCMYLTIYTYLPICLYLSTYYVLYIYLSIHPSSPLFRSIQVKTSLTYSVYGNNNKNPTETHIKYQRLFPSVRVRPPLGACQGQWIQLHCMTAPCCDSWWHPRGHRPVNEPLVCFIA